VRILVTGVSGYVGAAVAPRLIAAGHDVVGYARTPSRVLIDVPVVQGDAVAATGLDDALEGVQVAYYLIHSMEPGQDGFNVRDHRAAENFAAAARRAGVERIVYLGGPVPPGAQMSLHLRSRLEVEQTLLEATPGSVALRASVVISARSRPFRFLVHLVERLRLLPMPPWREYRTQLIDGRDVLNFLVAAATAPAVSGESLDIAGPDVLTWGEVLERIADLLLVGRTRVRLGINATPVAARVAAAIAGEDPELILPLMEGLQTDLLARDMRAPELLGVRLHSFDAAVEHALREWEAAGEPLAAR
jgi:uncharacterized protein YbjT (DUF2867 family)